MSIIEQVKHLKELSDTARANVYSFEALSQSLRESADTIEELSAKLQEANMERSEEICEDMTLNEAIKHLDEILQPDRKWDCEECKNEHIQLKKWLVELKEYRERSSDCGGWIACEERLPEEYKLYDITFENSAGIHSDSAIYNPYLKKWLWDADETELVENKVLAWAEKREPYRS